MISAYLGRGQNGQNMKTENLNVFDYRTEKAAEFVVFVSKPPKEKPLLCDSLLRSDPSAPEWITTLIFLGLRGSCSENVMWVS